MALSVSGLGLSGSAAGNYVLASNSVSGNIGTISPAPLTITADDLSREFGLANPLLTYVLTAGRLIDGDTLSGALATTAMSASPAGSYPITQGMLAATPNYRISFV